MSLPLRSLELLDAARRAQQIRSDIEQSSTLQRQVWARGFEAVSGEAFERGEAMLRRHLHSWALVADTLERQAAILESTAAAQQILEGAMSKLAMLPQRLFDLSPSLNLLYGGLARLGQELDQACAQQLNALCASPHPTPELSGVEGGQVLQLHDGTAVVAYGDLDKAAHIVTLVPGVGSSNPKQWPAKFEEARTIAATTGGAAVAWIGYVAPPNVPGGIATEPANVGGQALQSFQADLRARNPDAKLVVLGHSYGSVVTGIAASNGLEADTIIYAGSPGVPGAPKHHNTKVIGALNAGDPIGLTGTAFSALHGRDPAWLGYHSEKWDFPALGHSYTDNPEFLARLAKEVQGP